MNDWTEVFEAERPRLLGLAYRSLGSYVDAEDVVQEAWLRASRTALVDIDNPAAWLTTVTSRLALDRLRSLSRRREDYVGPWLPEPISSVGDPATTAEMADSLTLGFLVLLDQLSPVERVVFLLAEVFGEPYAAIAGVVGRSEKACRQVASRARRRLRPDDAVAVAERPAERPLLEALVGAIVMGRRVRRRRTARPGSPPGERRWCADRHAARRPVVGADRVARFLVNIGKRALEGWVPGWRTVNGQEAFTMHAGDVPGIRARGDVPRRARHVGERDGEPRQAPPRRQRRPAGLI